MIVHFNGMPGTGKLTVAKFLANQLEGYLIDNHSLIDTVISCCDRGSPEYFSILRKIIDLVFEQIESKPDKTYIFTNALAAELPEDRERLEYFANFAQRKNIPFVQVMLVCDLEENKKRITTEDRKLKGKLKDAGVLEDIYKNYTMYHPETQHSLIIDTTHQTSADTAQQIKNFMKDIQLV